MDNINRNQLREQIWYYCHILLTDGNLLLNGFYVKNLEIIQNAYERQGFRIILNLEGNNWVDAYFTEHEY